MNIKVLRFVMFCLIVYSIAAFSAIFYLFFYHPKVTVGQIWFSATDYPFEKPDTIYFEILEIERGYARTKMFWTIKGKVHDCEAIKELTDFKFYNKKLKNL